MYGIFAGRVKTSRRAGSNHESSGMFVMSSHVASNRKSRAVRVRIVALLCLALALSTASGCALFKDNSDVKGPQTVDDVLAAPKPSW